MVEGIVLSLEDAPKLSVLGYGLLGEDARAYGGQIQSHRSHAEYYLGSATNLHKSRFGLYNEAKDACKRAGGRNLEDF